MAHTYEELHKMTVAQMREIAKGLDHEAVRGYTTMHKHELLPALCTALGVEAHEHHEAVGINKTTLKAQMRELKVKRDGALETRDLAVLKDIRHKMKRLRRKIRRATV
jgi:hypothetical protein